MNRICFTTLITLTKQKRSLNKCLITCVSVCFFSVFFMLIAACGKKTFPLPPHTTKPDAVTDLSYSVNGDKITLFWTNPLDKSKSESDIIKYVIFRAKLHQSDCETCPVQFKKLGEVLVETGTKSREKHSKLAYMDQLVHGVGHLYKVVGVTSKGLESDGSNIVKFNF